jgi:hypothetical protein
MKKLFAMAVPILPGKTAQWRKFAGELTGNRHEEFNESRQRLGVHERTFHQTTPMGDFVIVTLEGENPAQTFADFAKANDAFTTWFAKEVKEIHGFDLNSPPPGPMPELILDSMEEVLQS